MKRWQIIIAITLLFLSGCTHLGPKTVVRDRFDYNTAISDSWKEQTLLNIVKIRYMDMPLFVDVASIVSGYTLQGTVNMASTWSSDRAVQGDFFSMGSSGTFTDRPTITYKPITGQEFNKSFMTPIPPKAILFLIQTGWPADLIPDAAGLVVLNSLDEVLKVARWDTELCLTPEDLNLAVR